MTENISRVIITIRKYQSIGGIISMNPVIIRNTIIGEGRPKICAPIVGHTMEEIKREAGAFASVPVDVAEWRADYFEDVFETAHLLEAAKVLREILGDMPLLFTFRTSNEGGEREISEEHYKTLLCTVAASGHIDLVDVEIFMGEELSRQIIKDIHRYGVKVVGSNHDFHKTPPEEEIIRRLCVMQQMDADILKIALMPQNRRDVLTLLSATLKMQEHYTDRPLVTMSMGGTGVISRLAGECFGSALTFGAVSKASAPGQIDVQELSYILETIHRSHDSIIDKKPAEST